MAGYQKKGFLDQVADFFIRLIFLFIVPVTLAVLSITSIFSKDKDSAFFAWFLILYFIVFTFFLRRKADSPLSKTLFTFLGLICLILPVLTYLSVSKHHATCAERVGPGVNLRGCDLSGLHFDGADLTGANLQASKLNGTTFIAANLSNANLIRASLEKTDFTKANLGGAVLDGTDITNVIGLTASAMNSLGSWKEIKSSEPIEKTWQIMSDVCKGTGYADARAYTPGTITTNNLSDNIFAIGFADNYILSDYTKFDEEPNNSLTRWQKIPSQLSSLTACFIGHEIYYDTCHYSSTTGSADIRRAKYNVVVEIRETRTANVIASKNFSANLPRECPEKIAQGADAGVKEYVNFSEIRKWLEETLTKY